ncbi:hypothetical protein C1O63_0767 [Dehalococcoides mccartyi]|nr:hypothetical protein C1O63_0767 [Dehalococcoides mccartyi]
MGLKQKAALSRTERLFYDCRRCTALESLFLGNLSQIYPANNCFLKPQSTHDSYLTRGVPSRLSRKFPLTCPDTFIFVVNSSLYFLPAA